jgi:hypothetical protein
MTRLIAVSTVGRTQISGNEVGNHVTTVAGTNDCSGHQEMGTGEWEPGNV